MLLKYFFAFSQSSLFVLGNGGGEAQRDMFDIQGEYPVGPHIVNITPRKRF